MRHDRSRYGFTLIELLVVTSVIAVLVAILLPALSRARATGQGVACKSNVHQVYLGFATYAGENRGAFPWTAFWGDQLGDHLGNSEGTSAVGWPKRPVLKCPGESRVLGPGYPEPRTMYETDWPRCSYAMNWYVDQYNYFPAWGPARKDFPGRADNPGGIAAAPLIMDAYIWSWGENLLYFHSEIDDAAFYDPRGKHAFRHPGESANVLYLDGHAGATQHYLQTGNLNRVAIFNDPP
jgi:prepilin-type N-terminal cleavage/methylation domain-containing protein/prepilin-type processing-associated H-X9-DG protein